MIEETPSQAAARADDGALQETTPAPEEEAEGAAGDRPNPRGSVRAGGRPKPTS